ncbi:MAG: PaaI family thioesterase [Ilumatobacteraceae bacterium]
MIGPFYFRTEKDGSTRGAFVPEGKHANGGGIVHGGALMSFADAMLGALVYITSNGQFAVTVTFNCEFVGAGVAGTPIHATGRVVRDTKSMVFVQAELQQNAQPILTFSSVAKKITPR